MKRELKERVGGLAATPGRGNSSIPYEEGTERLADGVEATGEGGVTAAFPMKRELKAGRAVEKAVGSAPGNSSIPYEEGTERAQEVALQLGVERGNSSIPYEEGTESSRRAARSPERRR